MLTRRIRDDDLIRIRYYGRKVKGLGAAEEHGRIGVRVSPSAFDVLAPVFKKFQVLGNVGALTTTLLSLVYCPSYANFATQLTLDSLTLELLPSR